MTTQILTPALYYKHSGRYSMGGALAAFFGGALAAIVLGAVYAYVNLYIPIGGWVTFLITGGTGFGLGAIVGRLLKTGKVRNVPMAILIAGATAAILYFTAWIFWIYALLQRGNVDGTIMDLLKNPRGTW